MVYEKPIIDKRELLRALDPVHGRGHREYDRLRRAELLSTGVRYGRAHTSASEPSVELFCSLNRDAISALRGGHTETAREIRAHAQRIEHDTIGPWLEAVDELNLTFTDLQPEVAATEESRGHWVDRVLFSADMGDETEIAEPIWNAAREVAEIRSRYEMEHATARLTIGRVWKIDETLSEVRSTTPSAEDSFAFFTDEIFAAGLCLGDPVVVRHEDLAPGVFLTTIERGVERERRVSRVSGQPLPPHLEKLLDSTSLSTREHLVRPLRRVA
jgi:hypothetical protein